MCWATLFYKIISFFNKVIPQKAKKSRFFFLPIGMTKPPDTEWKSKKLFRKLSDMKVIAMDEEPHIKTGPGKSVAF
jgi:hypothetical protein